MDTVKLRNGSTEDWSTVQRTMHALQEAFQEKRFFFYQLVRHCQDPGQQMDAECRKYLIAHGLLRRDGEPEWATKNVVLSAVTGAGSEMQIICPKVS